jgi:hypothetical protein
MPLKEAGFLSLPASQGPYRVRTFFPEGGSHFAIGRLLLIKLFLPPKSDGYAKNEHC